MTEYTVLIKKSQIFLLEIMKNIIGAGGNDFSVNIIFPVLSRSHSANFFENLDKMRGIKESCLESDFVHSMICLSQLAASLFDSSVPDIFRDTDSDFPAEELPEIIRLVP